jgi:hypothetical protein
MQVKGFFTVYSSHGWNRSSFHTNFRTIGSTIDGPYQPFLSNLSSLTSRSHTRDTPTQLPSTSSPPPRPSPPRRRGQATLDWPRQPASQHLPLPSHNRHRPPSHLRLPLCMDAPTQPWPQSPASTARTAVPPPPTTSARPTCRRRPSLHGRRRVASPPPQEPRTLTSPELVAGVGEDEECVKKNSCEEGP